MSKVVSSPIALIVRTLKDYEVDGETMEELIREVGMEGQMLRQLIMGADIDTVKQLIEEKEQLMEEKERLEGEKIQTYNIETYSTVKVALLYRGVEYEAECRTYDDCDGTTETYTVRSLDDGQELHNMDSLYDEIVEYVDSQVIGNIR
jgi:hypothetical protein